LIRGPDTEAWFEDPTIYHSLDSAVSSFADSYKVLRREVQPMALAGLRRTKDAVERVTAIMRELLSGITYSTVPSGHLGKHLVEKALDAAHEKNGRLFVNPRTQLSSTGHNYTQKAVDHVAFILQNWFDKEGEIPFQLPTNPTAMQAYAQLPYWNTQLKYPPRDTFGMPMVGALTTLEQKQFFFADRIRKIAVELLRAEEWIF